MALGRSAHHQPARVVSALFRGQSSLGNAKLPAADRRALVAFQQKVGRLLRAGFATNAVADETEERLRYIKQALFDAPGAGESLASEARAIERRLLDLRMELSGDETIESRAERTPPAIVDRIQRITRSWASTSRPTTTHQRSYEVAAEAFASVLERLRTLIGQDLRQLEERMETVGAPWTPGRPLPGGNPSRKRHRIAMIEGSLSVCSLSAHPFLVSSSRASPTLDP